MKMLRALLFAALLLLVPCAEAQGCAACKANAQAAPQAAQAGLRRGIIVLLVPAVTIMFGFIGLIHAHRHRD